MWIVAVALLVGMPMVHGLGHYLAAGRPGRLVHALIPFYHCAGCGLFHPLSSGRRALALLGGAGAHYLALSAVALAMYLAWGLPTGTFHYVVVDVREESDAFGKLQPDDRLLSAQGHSLTWERNAEPPLSGLVQASRGAPIAMVIERGGTEQQVSVTPFKEQSRYLMGIKLRRGTDTEDDALGAIGHALAYPAHMGGETLRGLYEVMAGEVDAELTGPVGIASVVHQARRPEHAVRVGLTLAVYEALLFLLVDVVLLGFVLLRPRAA